MRSLPALSLSRSGAQWCLFFAAMLGAWAGLLYMGSRHATALPYDASILGALDLNRSVELIRSLCLAAPDLIGLPALAGMWAVMSLAMMAPTAVPVLASYQDLVIAGRGQLARSGFWLLLAGYLAVWLLFSAAAATLQMALSKAGLLDGHGVSLSPLLTVTLTLAAGLYQFTALKEACLSKCRSPMAFFMTHWQPGPRGALAMGLRHGAVCVGCCWALMLLGFVGGTMNMVWMALAMLLMILEKLPDIGRFVTRPLGVILILLSLYLAVAEGGLLSGV